MAKIAFTKFGLKKNDNIKIVNINGLDVEIKQYLPVDEKLVLISKVLSKAADENNFSNPIKLDVFTKLEILLTYIDKDTFIIILLITFLRLNIIVQ